MALPTWPETLPHVPLLAGLGAPTPFAAPARTEFEDGPDRMRRRAFTRLVKEPVQIRMTRVQFQAFETFYWDTLDAGTGHFMMEVVLPQGCETRRVYIDNGEYSAPRLGTKYVLAMTLCVFLDS
ncbi:hypothetical protein [Chelatococcus sp.]|uniref:hypothetical protein n=1 Tax=Chelatococcus sp. TaxID=1953771 RepID=UPI001EC03171|nr:hypothetical protein [Chelatococcus sp.]MBX3543576.1 hypothetical protein [Chelatococcus sp.]